MGWHPPPKAPTTFTVEVLHQCIEQARAAIESDDKENAHRWLDNAKFVGTRLTQRPDVTP